MLGGLNAGPHPPPGAAHRRDAAQYLPRQPRPPRTRATTPRRGCGKRGNVGGPTRRATPPRRGRPTRRGAARYLPALPGPIPAPGSGRGQCGAVPGVLYRRLVVPHALTPIHRPCRRPSAWEECWRHALDFMAARCLVFIPSCSAQAFWVLTFPMLNVSEHSWTFPVHTLMQALSAKWRTAMCLAVLAYGQGKPSCPVSHERRARTVPAWP